MPQELSIPVAKFKVGQKVHLSSGKQGYIHGCVYYAEASEWEYALGDSSCGLLPDENWYRESELSVLESQSYL